MEIKGTAVSILPEFIMKNFGPDKYREWFSTLPQPSQHVFKDKILDSAWYPMKDACYDPTALLCRMFYGGDISGAWELGRFSAEHGLRGVYRIFVKVGSVKSFIKRSATILPAYYKPSSMEVVENNDNSSIIRMTDFLDDTTYVENRIGGWMQRALEINGCKNVNTAITKSRTRGDPFTEFRSVWELAGR